MDQLGSRIDTFEATVQTRVKALIRRVDLLESIVSMTSRQPLGSPHDQPTAAVYMEQIKILTQNFLKERENQERMVAKWKVYR